MIDPRREAILIRPKTTDQFQDRTSEVSGYERQRDGKISIEFRGGRPYSYGQGRVRLLGNPKRIALSEGTRVEVNGVVWDNAVAVSTFPDSGGDWSRIFYQKSDGDDHRIYPAAEVRVLACPPLSGTANGVRHYWDQIVAGLDADDDPLVRAYGQVDFDHPETALRSYLTNSPIPSRELGTGPIFPFRCNLSQRQGVENGLTHGISVIEGPPGTGKTETILNLIANIVVRDKTVGIVSHTNAAVDNIRDKLTEKRFGHVLANLGKKNNRTEFFKHARQDERNELATRFADDAPEAPDADYLTTVDTRLRRLQETERRRAERRHELDSYRLELRHFDQHLRRDQDEVPDLTRLPLLRRSADRVLEYLAESDLERSGARPGLFRRIRKYFRYGSLRGLNPDDTHVVLRLQRAYYEKRISELDAEIARLDNELRRADFDALAQEHRALSVQALHAKLGARYDELSRTIYGQDEYKRGKTFERFIRDYPVLLSTCHSLRASLPSGFLLDYLIIDEASQVDPLVAALALSCCRNLVVVGDTRQLSPIPPSSAEHVEAPSPICDCRQQSILSSLKELYGDELPRTLLREHYRCEPAIIGFCNKKFYGHELIPYTTAEFTRPVLIVRTTEGNHMRQHREGGRSNQREVDVIEAEVIPRYCAEVDDTDIGITTPYRVQANKAGDALDQIDVKTVHKFQGRQKRMVVLTTVLDETWRGRTGLDFVDDPRLINVAVSRATHRFILVTNHDMMPTSRHIRDLVGHIRYCNPEDEVLDSDVVSIFDLLYRDHSRRLRSLAHRLKNQLKHPSEDIAWTVLHDIFQEEEYEHLTAVPQLMLYNLFPNRRELAPAQDRFIRNRASVDFVVYNRITNQPLLEIEVDGFKYHENNPEQRKRDTLKNEIFSIYDFPLLRLPTTGSGEHQRIRQALDDAESPRSRTDAR